MKKIAFILLFLLFCVPCYAIIIVGNWGDSGGSSAVVEPDVAAYWKFEESWEDETDDIAWTTYQDPTFDTSTPITGDASAEFDDSAYQYAYITYSTLPSGFPTSGTSYRTISVCLQFRYDNTGTADYFIAKYDTTSNLRSWAIRKGSDEKIYIYHGDGSTSYEEDNHATALSDDTDYAMCYTENGTTADYTLDVYNLDTSSAVGSQLTGTWANVMPIKSVHLTVGGRWGSNDKWTGEIDELKFYNDVLTGDQITAYFEGDFTE
jgi:hypothetical protein